MSDSDSDEAEPSSQPAQSAEVSQEWLDQQPPSPDDERGAAARSAAASAQTELDARAAKRHRQPEQPPGQDGLPVEV